LEVEAAERRFLMAVILVVEDEQLVRMGAVDALEHEGHEVIEAENADAAIIVLESRADIEVVFSDVRMPGTMDGIRLLHVIRRRWPPIRLILTSGTPIPGMDALPVGTLFIAKPYDHSALRDLIAGAN
jgi:two-component system, response regulator PdtaR